MSPTAWLNAKLDTLDDEDQGIVVELLADRRMLVDDGDFTFDVTVKPRITLERIQREVAEILAPSEE